MKAALLQNWDLNQKYGLELVADLAAEQMVCQPAKGMNHPAWILSHLCHYHPLILAIVRDEPCPDPAQHSDAPRFDEGSAPINDITLYPSKQELTERFRSNHELIAAAVRSMPPDHLLRPVPFERWKSQFVDTGGALQFGMLMHESVHLGQLSAWRRVQGLPRV